MNSASDPRAQAAGTAESSSSLRALLDERSAVRIEAYVDALEPAARLDRVLSLRGKDVKRLYEAVAGSQPLTLDDFARPGDGTIVFEGRNSLPLFSRFQKHFVRLSAETLAGRNYQTGTGFFTGPGYFMVKPASGQGEHGGEVLFDYTALPPSRPEGWPELRPNDRGFPRFVFMNLNDYVRRVARGVVVGKAYRAGVDQDQYFVLSRP